MTTDHGAAGFCTGHGHTPDEPRVWCETCQHIHIASIPEITYACHSCGFGSWHSETATEHEILCHGHETYPLGHIMRPVAAPDERTETVARVWVEHFPGSARPWSPGFERLFGAFAAAVVAALDDETARLRASADAWWSEYDRELTAHEATKAEAERLTRIVNGYDRTPAEQRAADAEAERDAARAALDRVRAVMDVEHGFIWCSDLDPQGVIRLADLRAALDPEEPR